MLTVDYERLVLRPGLTLLDIGAGLGRHAFEAARRGARVVAADLSDTDLKEVAATFQAMIDAGEIASGSFAGTIVADATRLPFESETFHRVIAAEVLEHIECDLDALSELSRVLKPGGILAVTVPSYLPEKICWTLDDGYHAPKVPGGHVRIYRAAELRQRLATSGLRVLGAHRAHALHSPYWWLKCAVGLGNDGHRAVASYRRFLEWDIVRRPTLTRAFERGLNPILGKSLVIYAAKP